MDMVPPNLLMELSKFSCHFPDVRIVPASFMPPDLLSLLASRLLRKQAAQGK